MDDLPKQVNSLLPLLLQTLVCVSSSEIHSAKFGYFFELVIWHRMSKMRIFIWLRDEDGDPAGSGDGRSYNILPGTAKFLGLNQVP